MAKLTGKRGKFTFGGTVFPFKVLSAATDRKMADSTDSADYDPGTDLLWPTQLAVSAPVELSIEGNFNTSSTLPTILAQLFTGAAAAPAVLEYDSGARYGHGNFDITNFVLRGPVDDTTTFTASIKSNGIFTAGS